MEERKEMVKRNRENVDQEKIVQEKRICKKMYKKFTTNKRGNKSRDIRIKLDKSGRNKTRQRCNYDFVEYATKHERKNGNRKRQTRRISSWIRWMKNKETVADTFFNDKINNLRFAIMTSRSHPQTADATLNILV